jgi:hypothetical protein
MSSARPIAHANDSVRALGAAIRFHFMGKRALWLAAGKLCAPGRVGHIG